MEYKYLYGVSVIGLIVIILVLGYYCFRYSNSLKELFRNTSTKKAQPLMFKTQYLNVPHQCKPYLGCMFPETYCKQAWKDCNAFQDCVDGVCKNK